MFNCSSITFTIGCILLLSSIPMVASFEFFGLAGPKTPSKQTSLERCLNPSQIVKLGNANVYIANCSYEAGRIAGKNSILDELEDRCAHILDSTLERQSISEDVFRFTPGDWVKIMIVSLFSGLILFAIGRWATDNWWRKAQKMTNTFWQKMTPDQKAEFLAINSTTEQSSRLVEAANAGTLVVQTPDQFEAVVEVEAEKQVAYYFKFDLLLLSSCVVALVILGTMYYRLSKITYTLPFFTYWTQRAGDFFLGIFVGKSSTVQAVLDSTLNAIANKFVYALCVTFGLSATTMLRVAELLGLIPRCLRRRINQRLSEVRAEAQVAQVPAQRQAVAQAPSAPENDAGIVHPPGSFDERMGGRVAKKWNPHPHPDVEFL